MEWSCLASIVVFIQNENSNYIYFVSKYEPKVKFQYVPFYVPEYSTIGAFIVKTNHKHET